RFSKGIVPKTLEAKILQDADRLDAMGAIGIARVFMTGGTLGRALYNPDDPFCRAREPEDGLWNLDHFYRKLLKLEAGMHTKTARQMAEKRADVLRRYLLDLEEEIGD
ncbi:MAG: phosphohydrolase, partial [Methanothrix sp.]